MDVEVIDIDESSKTRREDKGRDADHFFGSVYTGDNGKRNRDCRLCIADLSLKEEEAEM